MIGFDACTDQVIRNSKEVSAIRVTIGPAGAEVETLYSKDMQTVVNWPRDGCYHKAVYVH